MLYHSSDLWRFGFGWIAPQDRLGSTSPNKKFYSEQEYFRWIWMDRRQQWTRNRKNSEQELGRRQQNSEEQDNIGQNKTWLGCVSEQSIEETYLGLESTRTSSLAFSLQERLPSRTSEATRAFCTRHITVIRTSSWEALHPNLKFSYSEVRLLRTETCCMHLGLSYFLSCSTIAAIRSRSPNSVGWCLWIVSHLSLVWHFCCLGFLRTR